VALCVAVLPAVLGCDLLDRTERLIRPCPVPSLSDYDTEDLIHELIDRGVDRVL
jgi:DNA-binding NarL/FixJ family response regulator